MQITGLEQGLFFNQSYPYMCEDFAATKCTYNLSTNAGIQGMSWEILPDY